MEQKFNLIKDVIVNNLKKNKIKFFKITSDYNQALNDYIINVYAKTCKIDKGLLYDLEETVKNYYNINMETIFHDKIVLPNRNVEYVVGKNKYNPDLECFTIYLTN